MTKERISKFTGTASMTILDVMTRIDENARGILFIQDSEGKLLGSVTDGDIRRWIIKAGALNEAIANIMNPNPKYIFEKERYRAEYVMRTENILALPVVNRDRVIVDIVFLYETPDRNDALKADLSDVPVVIMAGGEGTRLYPFTKILPKPLIPIGDTPIVERIIHCYREYGIKKYYMTVNYKKTMIKSYFTDMNSDYEITYVEEEKPLGTGGSIRLIEDKLDKPLFVANCDSIILADYGDIYDYHKRSDHAITIVSALKNIVIPYGVLQFDDGGIIQTMEEKPTQSYFVNTGMYVMNPEMIDLIPEDTVFHMTHLVEKAMELGEKIGVYPVSEDSFLDMGEFSEMKRMEEKLQVVSDK